MGTRKARPMELQTDGPNLVPRTQTGFPPVGWTRKTCLSDGGVVRAEQKTVEQRVGASLYCRVDGTFFSVNPSSLRIISVLYKAGTGGLAHLNST